MDSNGTNEPIEDGGRERSLTFEEATDLFHDQAFDPDAVEFDPAARRIRLTFERTDETPPVPGVRWVLSIDGAEGFELEDKAETGAYLVNEILFDAAEGVIRFTNVLPGRFVVKARNPSLSVRRAGTPVATPEKPVRRWSVRPVFLLLFVLTAFLLLIHLLNALSMLQHGMTHAEAEEAERRWRASIGRTLGELAELRAKKAGEPLVYRYSEASATADSIASATFVKAFVVQNRHPFPDSMSIIEESHVLKCLPDASVVRERPDARNIDLYYSGYGAGGHLHGLRPGDSVEFAFDETNGLVGVATELLPFGEMFGTDGETAVETPATQEIR